MTKTAVLRCDEGLGTDHVRATVRAREGDLASLALFSRLVAVPPLGVEIGGKRGGAWNLNVKMRNVPLQ